MYPIGCTCRHMTAMPVHLCMLHACVQVKSKLRASGEAEVAKAKQRAAVLVEGERVAGVKKKKSHLSAPPSSSALAAQAQARQARAATPPLMGTAGVGPGSSGKLQGSSNRPPLPPSRPSPASAPAVAAAAALVPSAAAGGVGGSGVGAAYVAGKAQGRAPTPPPLRK